MHFTSWKDITHNSDFGIFFFKQFSSALQFNILDSV